MLSIAINNVFNTGFIALTVLIWRVSKRPGWCICAVVYGWAAIFGWSFLWAVILPLPLRGMMDSHRMGDAFPDGTFAVAALVGGWFWPATIAGVANAPASKKRGGDHAA
jgi:hypothetical protein